MEYTIQRLLVLRKLTRAVADLVRNQLKEHLAAIAPLLRPKSVFGDHIQGGNRETVQGQDKAIQELQSAYRAIAGTKQFNLAKELKTPLELLSTTPELSATVYRYEVKSDQETKVIRVTSPLKWVLNYAGFGPQRLQDALANQAGAVGDELQQCILQFLVMHITASRQPAITPLFSALRHPLSFGRLDEFGELPITSVSAPISTIRPPDQVIIESTEISGMPVFEEIVNIDD